MAVFFSPIVNPASWTFSHELMEIPEGFRYSGYEVRGLRCIIGAPASILAPFQSVLKKYSVGSVHFIELQMIPFLESELVQSLVGGVPTCYISFSDNSGFSSLEDNSHLNGNDVLRTADSVTIGMVFQDRVVRDPHYWTQLMLDGLTTEGISTIDWSPFNSAVDSAISGNDAPVILLDAQGSPMQSANVSIVYSLTTGEQVYDLIMIPVDEGNLQNTVSRMSLSISNLWSTASTFTLRGTVPAAQRQRFQFSSLENQSNSAEEITITQGVRHIQMVDLHEWFASQFVTGSSLGRFSRGNMIKTFINGPEFFDDLFRELHTANAADCGFHHVGYLIMHDEILTKLKDSDSSDLKLMLKDVMQRISDGGGKVRLLPAQFIHLSPGAPIDDTAVALMLIIFLSLSGFMILTAFDVELFDVDFSKIDVVGLALVIALLFSSMFIPFLAPKILVDSDGLVTFEFNKDVRDFAEGLTNGRAIIAPYPANNDDNPDTMTNWLIDLGLSFINQFGIYHQKYSIVKNMSGYIGYCGGIDLNTDRLDDEHHMASNPYHDTHLRIEGPAVIDIAQTFQERWEHEDSSTSGSPDIAFPVPGITPVGTPGEQIVQFGRTYFEAADSARALPFAPNGDRTILDTIINAINQAKEYIYIEDQYFTPPQEYRTVLLNKVANREIKKLVIVVPDKADQPFGDIEKQGFIDELATAQSTLLPGETVPPSILHIGFPRRNYHLPTNSMRASSGKCTLEANLAKNATSMIEEEVVLGKGPRLPEVPFYMAIEGEIIYAYKLKETSPNAAAAKSAKTARKTTRTYCVLRGDDLLDIGTKRKEHKKGAAVSVLEYKPIYVHSKTMIVDDMFLCQGSANVNQRGHYHDGEANIFSIPQNLKNGLNNPVRDLRIKLWADMLNLPRDMAGGILRDPIAAAELFNRTPQQGNRVVNLVGRPPMMVFGPTPGTSVFKMILLSLGTIATLPDLTYDKFYKTVVDPASGLKS